MAHTDGMIKLCMHLQSICREQCSGPPRQGAQPPEPHFHVASSGEHGQIFTFIEEVRSYFEEVRSCFQLCAQKLLCIGVSHIRDRKAEAGAADLTPLQRLTWRASRSSRSTPF